MFWQEPYIFKNPQYLFLLLLIPLFVGWYIWKKNKDYPSLVISSIIPFKSLETSWKSALRHVMFGLKMLALALIIIALARPQTMLSKEKISSEGIDIVIALDISSSMLARDFQPNRLEAAKNVAIDFINDRPNDRIGLVVFSGESFTQCPITTDHQVLTELIKKIKSGMIEDGTAIGLGLANAVDRLKKSEAKSKVIILLTDGENNAGFIDPETAAEMAKTFNIRVYTVGVGSIGTAPYPVQTPFGIQFQNMPVRIDENLLKSISSITGGQYFRATDENKLREIYHEIDRLEKTKIQIMSLKRYRDKYAPFVFLALILIVLDYTLRMTVLKTYP